MIDTGERITIETLDLADSAMAEVRALPCVIEATYDGKDSTCDAVAANTT